MNLLEPRRSHKTHPLDREVSFGSNRWEKECGGKLAYHTMEEAIEIMDMLITCGKNIHNAAGAKMSIYECRWCDFYHVGHTRGCHRETVYVSLRG